MKSCFQHAPDIVPRRIEPGVSIVELLRQMGETCFEARKVWHGAELFRAMVAEGDTIWLGIAGAGIAGGMGGLVISLIERGAIDVICSTGAQVYHDLHFAFGLPVKSICPHADDDRLREHGDTRIYDIGIREEETLEAQDAIIRRFVRARAAELSEGPVPSWRFNQLLGAWAADEAPHPERSYVIAAAQHGVPIFWDSHTNHSIAMNLVHPEVGRQAVHLSAQLDIIDSAAVAYETGNTGFVELGGGGPKNFIQQTGPTIHQILGITYEGADRGLQIGTALEREGSLSGCTFGEAVTWGKYEKADEAKLVQIWGDYSVIFPLLAHYVVNTTAPRPSRRIGDNLPRFRETLLAAQ
jgi:deoxyhypusine synthase